MNDGFLLDTNVISEFNRTGRPDASVQQWLDAVAPDALYVSVINLAEIQFGIELLQPSRRRVQLEHWMEQEFDNWFAGRVLPVDAIIVKRWALFSAERQREGRPLAQFDGLIVATAFRHGLTLVTRDIEDFRDLDVPLFNPWNDRVPPGHWPLEKKAEPPMSAHGFDLEREDDLDR